MKDVPENFSLVFTRPCKLLDGWVIRDMIMLRLFFFLIYMMVLAAAFRSSLEAGGRPDHVYETGGTSYYAEGLFPLYPVFSASDRFGSGDVTLWNRLRYSRDHFRGSGVPGALHNASETLDLRSSAFVFTGNASFRSDGDMGNASFFDYLLCPGYECYRDERWKIEAFLLFTNQFSWEICGGFHAPLPFVGADYHNGDITARLGIPCMIMKKFGRSLTASALWVPVYNTSLTMIYSPLPFMNFTLGYSLRADSYHIRSLDDADRKLYIHHQLIYLKGALYISSNAGLSLTAGGRFGCYAFTGRYVTEQSGKENLPADAYINVAVQFFL
jgi:hypothetical protein